MNYVLIYIFSIIISLGTAGKIIPDLITFIGKKPYIRTRKK